MTKSTRKKTAATSTATTTQSTTQSTTQPTMVARYEVDAILVMDIAAASLSQLPKSLRAEVLDAFEGTGLLMMVQTPEATVNVYCHTYAIRMEPKVHPESVPAAPSTPDA